MAQNFWNTFFLLFLDYISETPQFVLSKQGKTQLVDSGGNIYYKHKGSQNNGKTSWKCTSYFKTKCKACFTTDDTSLCVLKSNKEHNHWVPKKWLKTTINTFILEITISNSPVFSEQKSEYNLMKKGLFWKFIVTQTFEVLFLLFVFRLHFGNPAIYFEQARKNATCG